MRPRGSNSDAACGDGSRATQQVFASNSLGHLMKESGKKRNDF